MLRVGSLLLCLFVGAFAITCRVGTPVFSYSKECDTGVAPLIVSIGCCKKDIDGPTEVWDCAGANDICEDKKYKKNNDEGYEKAYTEICTAADCNSSTTLGLSIALLTTTLLAALRH